MYEEIKKSLAAVINQPLTRMDKVLADSLVSKDPDRWNSGQFIAALKMLGGYIEALAAMGIAYDDLEIPEWITVERQMDLPLDRMMLIDSEPSKDGMYWIEIEFNYNASIVDIVRLIPGRKYEKDRRVWRVPLNLTTAERLVSLIIGYGFVAGENTEHSIIDTIEGAAVSQEMSKADAAEIDIPGFGDDARALRPFQKAGVVYALDKKRTFIADDMGLGKTIEGLATVEAAEAYQTIVVSPAQLKLVWIKEALLWLPEHRTIGLVTMKGVSTARLGNGEHIWLEKGASLGDFDLLVVNYDILKPMVTTWRCLRDGIDVRGKVYNEGDLLPLDSKSKIYASVYHILEDHFVDAEEMTSKNGMTEALIKLNPKALIFDESHYCKNGKAQRTKALQQLADHESVKFKLALTGTPMLNRPIEIAAQLKIIGRLDEFGGWWRFVNRYCNPTDDGYGHTNYNGGSHLKELNERLRATCYIRRLKSAVLSELPAKQRSNISVELTNMKEYEKAEANIIIWLRERDYANRAFMEEVAHLEESERQEAIRERNATSAINAEKAEELVKLSHLKQLSARGKIEPAVHWITDFMESDEKLVVFAYHKDIQQEIAGKFPGSARVMAKGDYKGDGDLAREKEIDRFQNDPDCHLIVCGLKSGGVGITLHAASNVFFIEQGWNPAEMDQAEDRCHRIGQKDSVNVWNMIGADTIDIDTADLINEKRAVITAATDGGEYVASESIADQLVSRLINQS